MYLVVFFLLDFSISFSQVTLQNIVPLINRLPSFSYFSNSLLDSPAAHCPPIDTIGYLLLLEEF